MLLRSLEILVLWSRTCMSFWCAYEFSPRALPMCIHQPPGHHNHHSTMVTMNVNTGTPAPSSCPVTLLCIHPTHPPIHAASYQPSLHRPTHPPTHPPTCCPRPARPGCGRRQTGCRPATWHGKREQRSDVSRNGSSCRLGVGHQAVTVTGRSGHLPTRHIPTKHKDYENLSAPPPSHLI